MTPSDLEKLEEENERKLRDVKDFFGNWKEVRELISKLEDNDQEKAYERHCTDY